MYSIMMHMYKYIYTVPLWLERRERILWLQTKYRRNVFHTEMLACQTSTHETLNHIYF